MQTLPPFTTGQLKAIESIEDCGNGSAIECLGMVFGVVVGILEMSLILCSDNNFVTWADPNSDQNFGQHHNFQSLVSYKGSIRMLFILMGLCNPTLASFF